MNDVAIQVEGLGKRYRIGHAAKRSTSLREAIVSAATAPLRRLRNPLTPEGDDEFWALKDVSFDVKRGEVIGVIGRNGAGKSTLLKILSRITEPTEGQAVINGRVGSLLEVGTGFHPELTGRENVYLNGAILGMKRTEIDKKFDEIVAFSEIEKFLDTPVKHYSSGMYTRLAFAVAAHLDPEILIVDEVLAVGDASFQKKCLGKIGEVAKVGRTVLFVSHNMSAVQGLCSRAMVLQSGRVVFDGRAQEAVNAYLAAGDVQLSDTRHIGEFDFTKISGPQRKRNIIQRAWLLNEHGRLTQTIPMGSPWSLMIEVEGLSKISDGLIGFILRSHSEQWLSKHNTAMQPPELPVNRNIRERLVFQMKRMPLMPGSYWFDLSVAAHAEGRVDFIDQAIHFDVVESDVYGTGFQLRSNDGLFYLDGHWSVQVQSDRLPALKGD